MNQPTKEPASQPNSQPINLLAPDYRTRRLPRPVGYSEFSSLASGVESPSEEQQLRAIWNEVNVGATGFLDLHELSVVCDHIGMDSMNEQVRWHVTAVIDTWLLLLTRDWSSWNATAASDTWLELLTRDWSYWHVTGATDTWLELLTPDWCYWHVVDFPIRLALIADLNSFIPKFKKHILPIF